MSMSDQQKIAEATTVVAGIVPGVIVARPTEDGYDFEATVNCHMTGGQDQKVVVAVTRQEIIDTNGDLLGYEVTKQIFERLHGVNQWVTS